MHEANALGTDAAFACHMAAHRTAWHPPFAALIKERAPPGVDVEPEVSLTLEPQRADLLLILRDEARLDEACVMRGLWTRLAKYTLMEFKSVSRPPRPGDWVRLQGYAAQYHALRIDRIGSAANLSLVMVTARMTRALREDAERMGWTLKELGGGYYAVLGGQYPSFLVLLDEVSESEQDPLLGAFGSRTLKPEDRTAAIWMFAHRTLAEEKDMSELEGWEDYMEKLREVAPPEFLVQLLRPEERVAGLKPEERVAGLKPEDRRAGLSPDETVLVLADEILRALPDDFVEALPEKVRDEVRSRLRATH